MARPPAPWLFALESFEPSQLRFELFDDQTHHPNGLVARMADLFHDGPQRFPFPRHLFLQKLPPALQLLRENARPRQPRKRNPRQEGRTLPLHRPMLSFQRTRKRRAAFRRRRVHLPIGPRRGRIALCRADEPATRQLFERVVHLRPRNASPVAHLAPLELRVRLVSMHRTLREQAEQHEVRRRQLASPASRRFHPEPSPVTSLLPRFFASFFCSSTTTDIFLPAIAGFAPAPPPRKTHPAHRHRASDR